MATGLLGNGNRELVPAPTLNGGRREETAKHINISGKVQNDAKDAAGEQKATLFRLEKILFSVPMFPL